MKSTNYVPTEIGSKGFGVRLQSGQAQRSEAPLAARLLARLTPSVELVSKVERSYVNFEDCLPVVTPPPEVTPT
jgi:hypothetical protein